MRVCEFQKDASLWNLLQEFQVDWEPQLGDSPEAKGELLSRHLKNRQVQATAAHISFPRNRVILKLLTLPDLEPDQIAEAIALQCEAKGISPSEFVIDYAVHQFQESTSKHITVAAIRNDIFGLIQTIVKNCPQLQIQSMGLGEFGWANSNTPKSSSPQLLLIAEETEIQFVVTLNGLPLTFLNTPLPDDAWEPATTIATSVNRIEKALAEHGIETVFPCVGVIGPLAPQFLNATDNSVPLFLAEADLANIPARCYGMLPDKRYQNRFNFLLPMPLTAQKSNQNLHWKRLAVRLALACLFLMIVRQWYVDRLDQQADKLQGDLAGLSHQENEFQVALETADKFAAWEESKIVWSERLVDVLARLPSNERIVLKQIHMEKSDVSPAQFRIEGAGRTLDEVLAINENLLQNSDIFRLQPEQITRSDDDPYYEVNFTVSAEIIAPNND